MNQAPIGIIGGSGLYEIEGLKTLQQESLKTPFGDPSDSFLIGELEGQKLVFLPRHGRGHRILPTELNFRANIWGMKKLGVQSIISVSAVGSMKEEIAPGHMVLVDQFFDRTRGRCSTFFGEGVVAHVGFADPVCGALRQVLIAASKKVGAIVHEKGTYLCMEGPQFSTRAESKIYRQWGVDVIGMTNLQEAKLAREAELCYTTLALSTDYDCWHESEEDVTVEAVVAVMQKNIVTAQKIIKEAFRNLSRKASCSCGEALKGAIFTRPDLIPLKTKEKLDLIIGKYVSGERP